MMHQLQFIHLFVLANVLWMYKFSWTNSLFWVDRDNMCCVVSVWKMMRDTLCVWLLYMTAIGCLVLCFGGKLIKRSELQTDLAADEIVNHDDMIDVPLTMYDKICIGASLIIAWTAIYFVLQI